MSRHHSITPVELPPGYELAYTHTHPECQPKTYILCKKTMGLLAITGEGDSLTYELEDAATPNVWTTIPLFPRCRTHETAVNWIAVALAAGEARERNDLEISL